MKKRQTTAHALTERPILTVKKVDMYTSVEKVDKRKTHS